MSGLKKITACLLATCLLSVPLTAQGAGGRRNQGPPPNQGQRRGGAHFGDWLRKNLNTPPDQQKQALESDPKFQKLPPDRQERLKQRLQQFNALPPDQQQKILDRMEKWEHMTPEQHKQARTLFDRMRSMPEERRNSIRQQMHAFSTMNSDQRQKFMNSDQYKKEFSSDERDVMQQWLDLRDSDTESASPSLDDPPQK
jgi:phage-related protein